MLIERDPFPTHRAVFRSVHYGIKSALTFSGLCFWEYEDFSGNVQARYGEVLLLMLCRVSEAVVMTFLASVYRDGDETRLYAVGFV